MAYVNNGIERSLRLTVTKKVGGNVVQGYPKTYDGQISWGDVGYPTLTDTQLVQLSDSDFANRYNAFIAYVESIEGGLDVDQDLVGDGAIRDGAYCTSTTTLSTTTTTQATTTTTTPPVFEPFFVGTSIDGQPYMINTHNEVKKPNAFGAVSTTTFGFATCVDYDSTNKLLFVGGNNGQLHIHDLRYGDAPQMKTIQVFSSGKVSGLSLVGSSILIGKEKASGDGYGRIFVQPYYHSLDQYNNYQATESGNTRMFGSLKSFLYYGGTYYGVTNAGEIAKTFNPTSEWTERADWSASFTKIFETKDKLIILEDDDRPFWAPKSNPDNWRDWDVVGYREPALIDGCAIDGYEFLVITGESSEMIRKIGANLEYRGTDITPLGVTRGGGCCYDPATKKFYIGVTYNGSQRILQATATSIQGGGWVVHPAPAFMAKLFIY